jgi:hypothetical protein
LIRHGAPQNRACPLTCCPIRVPHWSQVRRAFFARRARARYSVHQLILHCSPQNRACPLTSSPIGVPHWSQVRPAQVIRFISAASNRFRQIVLQNFRIP